MRTALLACCLLVCAVDAAAQTVTDERVWLAATFSERGSATDPWRWSFDSYLRTREGVSEVDVVALRAMLTRVISPRSSIGGGYQIAPSFPAAGGTAVEQRVFGQYVWTAPAAGGTLSIRTRLEARFIEDNSGTAARLRQQIRFSRALRRGSRVAGLVYDEIFFHLNDTARAARGVDQNRAFGGLAVTISPSARVEAGYVSQWYPGHRGAPDRMNHVLSSALAFSF
jgi:hypothetical protein